MANKKCKSWGHSKMNDWLLFNNKKTNTFEIIKKDSKEEEKSLFSLSKK